MKKILVVDDSSMIRLVVSKSAKKAGYEVAEATNGQEGLEYLEKNADVDLILSDLNMPIMGGIEMIRNIKNIEKLKFIPIVILTTETKEELKQECRELGVKAWMVKPFNEKRFLQATMKLLG